MQSSSDKGRRNSRGPSSVLSFEAIVGGFINTTILIFQMPKLFSLIIATSFRYKWHKILLAQDHQLDSISLTNPRTCDVVYEERFDEMGKKR